MATRPPPYNHPAVDSRPPPPPFSHNPAPPPQQHPPHQQHQHQHQHQHQQPQHHHHHHHHQAPPPPQQQHPSQPPPPPQGYYQQPPYAHPPPSTHQAAPPPPQGLSLPPIQSHPGAAPPPPPEQQQSLPPYRHPSFHDPREGPPPPEYQYNHARSGHATPAPVNRSYSHDSSSHQQRTPTTPAASGPYQQATSAPESHGPPPAHHMEHGQHHGYAPTNGMSHGLPHPPAVTQGPPPGHDQTPYMTPVMENHHGYSQPPPQHMYGQPSYGPNSNLFTVQKKKQMRATQACEQCRQRKQKCDEGSPCSFCKENSLNCTYRETPPAKTDKNMEKVISHLESLQGALPLLSSLADKINGIDERVRRIEYERPQAVAGAQSEQTMTYESEPIKRKPELDDHRTAPHKLILLWPSVRPLMENANVDVNDGYVMEAEDRGVLRLYGRGEGIDEHDGTQPGGAPSPARSEDSNEMSAPTPPEGVWGTGFAAHPHPEIRRSEPYNAGGLKPDGSLDLDVGTINVLYESYMKHMHIMHPFLDKGRVRKLFDTFINRYGTGNKPQFKNYTFAVGNNESDRPLKRQRSNGSTSAYAPGSESGSRARHLSERSPGNAIVYLVMALGKICAHKEPLPGFAQDSKLNTNANVAHQLTGHPGYTGHSPLSVNIKPSPTSPKSTPAHATPLSNESGMRLESRSRRSSFDGSSTAGLKNMDVIPGLAYYAKAAEVLGDMGDGYDLVHAQMFLLAGLYKGQLARVKESMSWITMAGRATQSLLERYKLYNKQYWSAYGDVRSQHMQGQRQIKDKRHNLIVLASWTCLQLESDILAELRLPSSGIQSIENLLLLPHHIADEDDSYAGLEGDGRQDEDAILVMYTAQMYLRRRLNQVHREMYGPECLGKEENEVQEMLKGHEQILSDWRQSLPPQLAWDDSNPPPSDILSARLRAKYWGAKYIVNRPFLDYALHIMPHVDEGNRTVEEVSVDAHGNPRDKAEIHIFKAIKGMGEHKIWHATKRCIEAAMQSTVAFDGVPNRLIVTNIHGTAHAQFGNMLVLSATYYNNYLKQLIDSEKFKGLLERTIQFLRRLAPISPTCSNDCQILEKINRLLFGIPQEAKYLYRNELEPPSASASFTS